MLHRARELLHVEHEAAVAVHRQHRPTGKGDLGAEGRGEAGAEGALVARGQKGPGAVDGKQGARHVADLGQLVDEDAVLR